MNTHRSTKRVVLLGGAVLLAAAACNQAPEGLQISLEPAQPYTLDALQVVVTSDAVDPNAKDEVAYRYVWTVDSGRMEDLTEASVPSAVTSKGQVWEVSVTPWDGKLSGAESTATVTILNSLPTATVAADPPEPRTEDAVELEVDSADNDNDKLTFRYAWTLNGSVSSLTADTLRSTRTNKGELWEVSVYPNDGEDEGEPAVTSFVIQNTPPSVLKAKITFDGFAPTAGSVLSCQGTGWSDVDEDDEGYRVQWYVNGTVSGSSETLSGAFSRGDSVACRLTPFDGDDEGEPVSSDDVIIRNEAPKLESVAIGPEAPKDGTAVTSTLGDASDGDGDEISYRYSWRIGGREVAVSEELPPNRFKRDDQIVLWVTPSDGYDDGEAVKSNTVIGGNNLPVLTSLALDSTELYTNDVLGMTYTTKDFDGDDVDVSVDWYVNSKKLTATGDSLDGKVWFSHFDKVYAIVRPDDGADLGAPVTSATLVVKNTKPTAPELVLDPAKPKEGEDQQCKITGVSKDADLDPITYTFAWTVAGKSVSGSKTLYANDTLSGSDWGVKDDVACFVTPNDGYEDGEVGEAGIGRNWKGPATFTTCGKTGSTGPSQSQCDTAYKGTAIEGKVTLSAGIQEFKIPSTAKYRIEVWGAQGGKCGRTTTGCEGPGARMRGDFSLSSGQVIQVLVGQSGGGKGFGGGGGGGTFVVVKGGKELIIAGGGGGGGHVSYKGYSGTTASCGLTGGLSGAGKGGCSGKGGGSSSGSGSAGTYNNSGGGAGYSGGGVGNGTKTNPGVAFTSGGAGGVDTGGFGGGGGGVQHSWSCSAGNGGGSGGGGYSGGGGGGANCNGPGGGGGSYNGGASASNSTGVNRAAGKVVISKL